MSYPRLPTHPEIPALFIFLPDTIIRCESYPLPARRIHQMIMISWKEGYWIGLECELIRWYGVLIGIHIVKDNRRKFHRTTTSTELFNPPSVQKFFLYNVDWNTWNTGNTFGGERYLHGVRKQRSIDKDRERDSHPNYNILDMEQTLSAPPQYHTQRPCVD